MLRQNLHNHTLYSDGSFLPEEIITAAISAQIDLIGISDHFFTTKVYGNLSYQQWFDEFWHRYLYSLGQLKEYFAGQIRVAAGIEIDSALHRTVGAIERLPWSDINSALDYVLFEYVGESCIGGLPVEKIAEIRQHCTIPVFLVHSDLDYLARKMPLEDFFNELRQNDIGFEIVAGKRNRWFWKQYDASLLEGVKLCIGSDTHNDISEVANLDLALNWLETNGLLEQLTDL